MFNLNNANMENLITQINKERLVNSDTALMMKELYYYVPCEYWYDKQDRLRTDIEGRNTPMYMCECPTLAACIQWMIQTREYTFQTEQNVAVWHVVVRAGDYVLYDSESNADAFCVSIRPRACFFPLFSFLPLWLHYNLNPLCVQY